MRRTLSALCSRVEPRTLLKNYERSENAEKRQENAEKRQTDAVHATVRHFLDFYRKEFPSLEGQQTPSCSGEF